MMTRLFDPPPGGGRVGGSRRIRPRFQRETVGNVWTPKTHNFPNFYPLQYYAFWRAILSVRLFNIAGIASKMQGQICRGVGGSTLPMIFLTPESRSVDLSSWGSIKTLVLVLHACGTSTLSPVGDPPVFFFYKSDTAKMCL